MHAKYRHNMREILHVILHVILREDGDMRASQDAPQGRRWERSYQSQLRARPLARYPLTQAHQQTPQPEICTNPTGRSGTSTRLLNLQHASEQPQKRQNPCSTGIQGLKWFLSFSTSKYPRVSAWTVPVPQPRNRRHLARSMLSSIGARFSSAGKHAPAS